MTWPNESHEWSSQPNRGRMTHLITVLQKVPADRFDLEHWRKNKGERLERDITDLQLRNDCGTAACAIGWACADPKFKAQGLFFDDAEPQLEGRSGWEAIEKFFSLNDSDAWHLFGGPSYHSGIVTPQDVIARIQDLLEST